MDNFQLIGIGFVEIGAETAKKLRKEEKDSAQLNFFAKKWQFFFVKFFNFSMFDTSRICKISPGIQWYTWF